MFLGVFLNVSICVSSICAVKGTWEKIITQLSYIGKILLLSKPPSASTIHVIKNLSPPTDKNICSLMIMMRFLLC